MEKLKILLLEDNLNDAELIKNELKNTIKTSIEFKRTVTKKEFIQQIKNFKPDLILLDRDPLADISNLRDPAGVMVRGKWIGRDYIHKRLDEIAAKYAEPVQ